MSNGTKATSWKKTKTWIIRFVKFNLVGVTVFFLGTVIFAVAFSTFGAWTWVVANASGSVLQFSLISYLNKTKRGKIFNSCETQNGKL